jgi:hypothetical protein
MKISMGTVGRKKLRYMLWLLVDLGVLNAYDFNVIMRASARARVK